MTDDVVVAVTGRGHLAAVAGAAGAGLTADLQLHAVPRDRVCSSAHDLLSGCDEQVRLSIRLSHRSERSLLRVQDGRQGVHHVQPVLQGQVCGCQEW